MGIERRGGGIYYYKKVRVGSRVESRYAGSGLAVFDICRCENAVREESRKAKEVGRKIQTEIDDLTRLVAAISGHVDEILADTLQDAGYHRHKRGEWRKKRKK
jgi:hypothetical protein